MLARIRKAQEEHEGGFTLIELLVVIIIIGILAAIAIPVFLNQRKKAVDASMKSDLRTVANAEETYFVDNQAYDAGAQAARRSPSARPEARSRSLKLSPDNTITVTVPSARWDWHVLHRGQQHERHRRTGCYVSRPGRPAAGQRHCLPVAAAGRSSAAQRWGRSAACSGPTGCWRPDSADRANSRWWQRPIAQTATSVNNEGGRRCRPGYIVPGQDRTADEGFTLIELLVVIIIIGILAAIAIPVYFAQRDRAYDSAAKSDLRNLAQFEETLLAGTNTLRVIH